MTACHTVNSGTVLITVELFGLARIKAGVNTLPLQIDAQSTVAELALALAQKCPALLGNALREDDGITIAEGYALNRNGLTFLPADAGTPLALQPSDTLLLLPNQAGG